MQSNQRAVNGVHKELEWAEVAERQGRLVEALRAYHGVLAHTPGEWRAHLGIGRIALLMGEAERALESFMAVLVQVQTCAEAFRGRALAFFALGEDSRALEDLERALRLCDGDTSEVQLSLGCVLNDLGRSHEAMGHLRTVWDRNPGDPDVALELAYALAVTGAQQEARLVLDSVAIDAEEPLYVLLQAEGAAASGALGKAAQLRETALDGDPELAERAEALPHLARLA